MLSRSVNVGLMFVCIGLIVFIVFVVGNSLSPTPQDTVLVKRNLVRGASITCNQVCTDAGHTCGAQTTPAGLDLRVGNVFINSPTPYTSLELCNENAWSSSCDVDNCQLLVCNCLRSHN